MRLVECPLVRRLLDDVVQVVARSSELAPDRYTVAGLGGDPLKLMLKRHAAVGCRGAQPGHERPDWRVAIDGLTEQKSVREQF